MKHILLFIFISLIGYIQEVEANPSAQGVLIVTQTDGCNNYGGHSNNDLINVIQLKAVQAGLFVTVIGDQDLPNINPSNYCLAIAVNTSGDAWDTPTELAFLTTFAANGGKWITIHAGGGDTNRHSSVNSCNFFTNYWAEFISGNSLNQGSKHENQSGSEMITKDLVAKTTADSVYLTGLSDSLQIFDEFYYTKWSGSYWNPTNKVLWWVDVSKNGEGPMPSVWIQGDNINIALGHANGSDQPDMANPTKFQYDIFDRILEVEFSKCGTPAFPIEWEPLLEEPKGEDLFSYTLNDNILVSPGDIQVFNMFGQEILTTKNATVNFNRMEPQMYFVKLRFDDGSQTSVKILVR